MKTILFSTILTICSLFALMASAPPTLAETKAPPTASSNSNKDEFYAPMGFTLVEEDISLNMKALPLALMDEAVSDFSDKNFGEATGDLKAASRFLRATRGSKPNEKAAQMSKVSADNLDMIAKEIRGSQIKSTGSLKERLGQVAYYQSLARRTEAASEWSHRQMKQAGYDLDAAATALERSMAWSGKARSSDNDDAVKNSRAVAAKLIRNSGWEESDVRMALANLATVTAAVGEKVLPEGFKAAEPLNEF